MNPCKFHKTLSIATLLLLLGACKSQETRTLPPEKPGLCGMKFQEARGAELMADSEPPLVRSRTAEASFELINYSNPDAVTCTFILEAPGLTAEKVFFRYGQAGRSGAQVQEAGKDRLRITYRVNARSYGLVSVEPPVKVPDNPRQVKHDGLVYTIEGGAWLRLAEGKPLLRSLAPETLVTLRNPKAQPAQVDFVIDNNSARLSQEFAQGLEEGRALREGPLRVRITGRLPAGGQARAGLRPKPLPAEFTFAFGGDIKRELGTFATLMAKLRQDANPLFLLAAGDYTRNSLPYELAAYEKTIAGLDMPIYSVWGNHELRAQGPVHSLRHFGPRHFSLRVGPLLLLILDSNHYTEHGFLLGAEQLGWAHQILRRHQTQPWKILALHHPPHPLHGESADSPVRYNMDPAESRRLRKLAREEKVAYVLSGHAHLYARGTEDDVIYLTSGGGGARLHSYKPVDGFRIDTRKHLMVFSVSAKGIEERVLWLDKGEPQP